MDAFLDATKTSYPCSSIEDLTLQLTSLREAKVTENRAEHISITFEFSSAVTFDVAENENDAGENAQNIDPSLGGSPAVAPLNGPSREIRARDTLNNQPQDDPVLQKAVAKHIASALGLVDGRSWITRSVSRAPAGWTFTYICKDSSQAYMRQNAKTPAKVIVGESSGKDGQDPINLGRPAFDCRGSVTIAFAKTNKVITVRYEHTPFHKTVAELAELYAPPPPPKRTAADGKQNGEEGGKRKKRKKNQAADGAQDEEGSNLRKRKKRKTGDLDDADGEMEKAGAPGEKRPKVRKRRALRKKSNSVAGESGNPEAQDVQASQAPGQPNALLNLPPGEAARRCNEANRKLTEAGILPETLSTEQFSIFSNQSPDLQAESLSMLVKYGAERLRIVHPNKDANVSSSASPVPAQQNGAAEATPAKKSRKKNVGANGEDDRLASSLSVSARKPKKTRGSCQACRAKKIKCSKGKPECTECITAGIVCDYPLQKSRKSASKSAEVVEDDPEDEPVDQVEQVEQVQHVESLQPDEQIPEEEASDLGSPGFNTSHHHVPDIVSQPEETSTAFPDSAHGLYQSASTGLAYPQQVPDEISSGLDYSSYSAQPVQQHSASTGAAYSHQPQATAQSSYPDLMVPVPAQPAQPSSPMHSQSRTRRSLPSGAAQSHNHGTSGSDSSSTWQVSNTPVAAAPAYSGSPNMDQQSTGRQSRGRNAVAPPTYETQRGYDGIQQAAALSQAALQKPAQSSPIARTVSPFSNPVQASRAKSRQSQRSQNRGTPVDRASAFQQPPPVQTAADTSAYSPSSAADSHSNSNYDAYSRYTATTQSGQPSSRVAYEHFSHPATASTSNTTYPSYEDHNTRSHGSASTSQSTQATQSMSNSYTKTVPTPSSNSWSNNSTSRNNTSYTSNSANTSTSSYNIPTSTTQQSKTVQSFNVRPQSTALHTRSSSSSYNQRAQPQQQQQQQPSYNSYPSQPQSSNHQSQQDWYGFGSTNDSASTNYGSSSRGGGSRATGYGQSNSSASHHRPSQMNISGNTYSSIDNDQAALYEMLRNNPSH